MWLLLGLLVIAVGLYIFLYVPVGDTKTNKQEQELSQSPEIADTGASQQILLESNTGTLQAFVYPLGYQRTGQLTMCSSSSPAAPGEPECSTGRFSMCACEGGNCDACKHKGYVNVLNISNVVRLELLTVPDASRQKMAGCQLVVRTMRNPLPPDSKQGACPSGYSEFTEGGSKFCCAVDLTPNAQKICGAPSSGTKVTCAQDANNTQGLPLCPAQLGQVGTVIQEETLVLPNIPLQKWTMITIAREGRRFDVYYNASLVLSKRTQYMIASTATFGPIIAGDPNLTGKVAAVEVSPTKKTSSEIQQNYLRLADTNGKPFTQESLDFSKYIPSCEGGSCLGGPTVRPASPLMDWDTEYA